MVVQARALDVDEPRDPLPSPEACYRAVESRDGRFDGRLFLGVTSTGIYCRPSCPARTPHPANCRYFTSGAAAVAAGFRACLRCRPDALPGGRDWDHRADLAARAIRLIRDGFVDQAGVAGLAQQLHVSDRHLRRTVQREFGVGPERLAVSRRAQTARLLLEQTSLSTAEIAFAAGFGSIRQFNDVVRAEFGRTPSQLRARRRTDREPVPDGPAITLRLRAIEPFGTEAFVGFLARRAVPECERVGPDDSLTRVIAGPSGPATAEVHPPQDGETTARIRPYSLSDVGTVVAAVRRWWDLDVDPERVAEVLSRAPALAGALARNPGVRIPGCPDPFESAVRTVIGQQVSVAGAQTVLGRLVRQVAPATKDDLVAFPSAAQVAALSVDTLAGLGMNGARARTLHTLASSVAAEEVRLDDPDREATRAALARLRGIGSWSVEMIGLRGWSDPDAFPAGDLGVRRALGDVSAKAAQRMAEEWRPWRGYATVLLWEQL